ncbi:class I SAM-dependent methyltransferase [Clostridium sp. AL.422]|uniref:class I SAM-dependent methyltransferase n=1 Tax=Clostridium TaxID=1485 RepID=UPI00293DD215|nr:MULTISPECIES: class I SAM-dependent methyltransferase [unclassified Clostridium]MDV4151638.1 class I SAM-dependent methyltransferase [Clostridium sp. AL.422]
MSYSDIYKQIGFQREIKRLEKQANLGSDREVRMLRNLGVADDSIILEVGSGPGFYSKILLDNFSNSEVILLDVDETLLNYANNMLSEDYKERVTFIQDDIMNSSMPDDYFDIIIARFIFQHLSDSIAALKEIYRILKPGGKLIIIDVDSELWGLTYPKNDLIKNLNSNLAKYQASLNGNRDIGRRLLTLLKLLKFKNLNIESVINHSDILGKENFRYNFDKGLESDPRLGSLLKEYNEFFNLSYSSIMLIKFFFYGEKPIEEDI